MASSMSQLRHGLNKCCHSLLLPVIFHTAPWVSQTLKSVGFYDTSTQILKWKPTKHIKVQLHTKKSRPKLIDITNSRDTRRTGWSRFSLSILKSCFCVRVILDHLPMDLWRSLQQTLFFQFGEKRRNEGEEKCVQACLHSSVSLWLLSYHQDNICGSMWAVFSFTIGFYLNVWPVSFNLFFKGLLSLPHPPTYKGRGGWRILSGLLSDFSSAATLSSSSFCLIGRIEVFHSIMFNSHFR